MADYFNQTVIQPNIPAQSMTPLERLLLTNMFAWEIDHGEYYFFAEDSPNPMLTVEARDLRAAIAASQQYPSSALPAIQDQISRCDPNAQTLYLDLSSIPWESVFQDLLLHNPEIPYISAITSFTCSKMRPDGFGGLAVLITAKAIRGKSTHDVLEDLLEEEEAGSFAPASTNKEDQEHG